jgi:hypothetical protein
MLIFYGYMLAVWADLKETTWNLHGSWNLAFPRDVSQLLQPQLSA